MSNVLLRVKCRDAFDDRFAGVLSAVHELGLRSIHLMIISLTPSGEELTLDKLTPLWRVSEGK